MPRPATWSSGSSSATTTRVTPASIRAVAQGPVRPWWAQGSRVTYAVAPRAGRRPRVERGDLGVRAARAGRWRPPPRPRRRGRRTQPTQGFGGGAAADGLGEGDRPGHRLRVVHLGPFRPGRRAGPGTRGVRAHPLPSGLSPSAPASNRIGATTGGRGLAGSRRADRSPLDGYRRSGLTPTPRGLVRTVVGRF